MEGESKRDADMIASSRRRQDHEGRDRPAAAPVIEGARVFLRDILYPVNSVQVCYTVWYVAVDMAGAGTIDVTPQHEQRRAWGDFPGSGKLEITAVNM